MPHPWAGGPERIAVRDSPEQQCQGKDLTAVLDGMAGAINQSIKPLFARGRSRPGR